VPATKQPTGTPVNTLRCTGCADTVISGTACACKYAV
jgi:hypothetical protein